MATCYRHPGRETAVSCSNCGRPICPDCMTPTSVGMRCPECSREKTRVVRRAYAGGEPIATYTLIGMNVLAFLATLASGSSVTGSVGGNSVLEKAALNGPKIADGEWWRIITSGFMHYGFLHLLFNMYALYILGTLLEPAVGRVRFVLIYFVALISGSVGALILDPNSFTAGASGAVFGLMSAAIVVMRNRGISALESGLGIWLFLNLAITFTVSGISIGGHIGGLIGGAVAALVLVEIPDHVRGVPRWSADAAAALLGVAAFAVAVAIA
jgi:membrane associated rhomboid family serine protease